MTGHEPAFPQTIDDMGTLTSASQGMSIREYFAAKAMQGLLSNTNIDLAPDEIAQDTVLYADALIQALNEKQP